MKTNKMDAGGSSVIIRSLTSNPRAPGSNPGERTSSSRGLGEENTPPGLGAEEKIRQIPVAGPRRRYSARGQPIQVRFNALVDRSGGIDACWPWLGRKDPDGYGRFDAESNLPVGAHRLALEFVIGKLPAGAVVRHLVCNNPPCCNPFHLAAGSIADNNRDAVEQGRHARGERQPNARLTRAKVIEIVRLLEAGTHSKESIGRLYGVTGALVGKIERGERWRHVTGMAGLVGVEVAP